jgi:CBS domain-containing protein
MQSLLQGHDLAGGWPIKPENIKVNLSENIFTPNDPGTHTMMKGIWDEFFAKAISQGKIIEDLPNFRIDGVTVLNGEVHIEMSLVPYWVKIAFREYLKQEGTSIQEFDEAELPRGIGIGGILQTSDGKYVFADKSGGKTNAQYKIGVVGGIPTANEITLNSGETIVAHLISEIVEELGISPKNVNVEEVVITDIYLTNSGSIMVMTEAKLNITADEVKEKFENRKDTNELTNIIVVSEGEELREILEKMGSYHVRMWELHEARMQGEFNEFEIR